MINSYDFYKNICRSEFLMFNRWLTRSHQTGYE